MHHMAPKAVERNLRRQKVLSWRFQKSFFEMWVMHSFSSSGYHFVKIDKNRFLLTYNRIGVSDVTFLGTYGFPLDPQNIFHMHYMALKSVARNLRPQKMLSWRFKQSFVEKYV